MANDVAGALAIGALPAWNLGDLYAGPDAPAIAEDMTGAGAAAALFRQRYLGRLGTLDSATLGSAIAEYERMSEVLGRILSFAQLLHAGNMQDPAIARFHQTMQEQATDVSSETLFFTLELNRLDDDILDAKLADPAASRYRPWLRDLRALRPYQLSDDLERLLHEKHVAGGAAWVRLFDETMAALRFPIDDQLLPAADAFDLLTDRDLGVRRRAANGIASVLKSHEREFALIANTLAKDKAIDDKWRGFKRPVSSRNLANQVEDGVVDALVSAVKQAYPSLSHRYYHIKARWFGWNRLDYWDRNAPLPEDDRPTIPWSEARRIVLDAYGAFSPAMAELGQRFFDRPWIDAGPRPGKAPGAFAHPTVPGAHPYLLLNYYGKPRDVMTLAHELGHGVHQILAAPRGHLMADTPLTLAETASVFGEMLTFQAMLAAERDTKRRRILIAGKVEANRA